MSYNQYLPNYIHDFEKYPDFITRESEHYIFHFLNLSEAQKDIENIIRIQELGYLKILSKLSLSAPKKKIEYYFYPDAETKKKLMGDDWYAQAIYDEFRVHVLYTYQIKPIGPHEDVHLLSLPLGLACGFLQEGLAESFTEASWDGKAHIEHVKNGYNKKIFPSIKTFFRHEAWLETDDADAIFFYCLAGEFTKFLIAQYGIDTFKTFYQILNRENSAEGNIKIFENFYKKSIDDVEKDFIKTIF